MENDNLFIMFMLLKTSLLIKNPNSKSWINCVPLVYSDDSSRRYHTLHMLLGRVYVQRESKELLPATKEKKKEQKRVGKEVTYWR